MKNTPASSLHASNLLKLLQNQPVTAAEIKSLAEFAIGSHPGSIAEHAATLLSDSSFIQSLGERETKNVVDAWQKKVDAGLRWSPELSRQFIYEVAASIEDIAELSERRVLTGTSILEKGEGTDILCRRSPDSVKGWSLELTVAGSGQYKCLRQTFETQPGDIILLAPESFHEHKRSPQVDMWTHFWLYFYPQHHASEWLRWPEVSPGIYRISLGDTSFQKVKSVFESINELASSAGHSSDTLQVNLVEQVLIRCFEEVGGDKNLQLDARIQKALEFMNLNLHLPLSLNDLAKRSALSKAQFSLLFKEQLGCTPIAWREERRIARATQLLMQTSSQIQEIAERVGYEDPLYFSRVFTRWLGCSPRQYRQSLIEKA